jgi:DNA-binding IclR family transcriptional regulator
VAVPVFGGDGEVSAAIAVIGPLDLNLGAHVETMRACATAVAHAVGVLEREWFED